MDGLENEVEEWLVLTVAKKLIPKAVTMAAAFAVSKVQIVGIHLSQPEVMAAAYLGLEALRHALAVKLPGLQKFLGPAAVFLMLGIPARADSPALSAPAGPPSAVGVFLAQAASQAENGAAGSLGGKVYDAVYLPLRTFNVPGAPKLFDIGAGAVFGAGKPEGIAGVRLNLASAWNGIFGPGLLGKFSTGPTLPDFFLGPVVRAPFPAKSFTWRNNLFIEFSVRLASFGGS